MPEREGAASIPAAIPRGRRLARLGPAGASLLLLTAMRPVRLPAQAPPPFGLSGPDFLSRPVPAPSSAPATASRYNLKLGNLTARLSGSVETEFNDNINLSASHPRADLALTPYVGLGFAWPLDKANVLHLDVDAGYRWYLNTPALDSAIIAPSSTLQHDLRLEKVHVNLHDTFGVQVDPVSLGPISGGTNQVVNFRRFNNTSGFSSEWHPYRDVSLIGGFDYTYDRSLNHDFTFLDQDLYAFHAGGQYTLSPRWTAGLLGNYSLSRYVQSVQNNGTTYGLGPSLAYRPTSRLAVDLAAGYTVATFQPTGTIRDSADFHGVTYEATLTDTINSHSSQDLRVAHTPSQGVGSNFTETTDVRYEFRSRIRKALTLHVILAYQRLRASGAAGETADRYLAYLGGVYHFSRRWFLGAGYSFALKNSNLIDQGYTQNRLTLDLTRQF